MKPPVAKCPVCERPMTNFYSSMDLENGVPIEGQNYTCFWCSAIPKYYRDIYLGNMSASNAKKKLHGMLKKGIGIK